MTRGKFDFGYFMFFNKFRTMKRNLLFVFITLTFSVLAQQKEPITILGGHADDINCLAVNPAGTLVATGGNDKQIQIYKADSPFALLKTFPGLVAPVSSIQFSQDGKLIAAGIQDNSIRIWDSVYRPYKTFEGHTDKVNALWFDAYRRYLFSGGDDRKIQIWDLTQNKIIRTIEFGQIINCITQTSNPNYLIVTGNTPKIMMYNLADGKLYRSFDGHTDAVNSVAISPDNNFMVSGSNDKTARIWDLKTGKEIKKLGMGCWKITTVAYSKDGKYIVTGCNDGTIKVWHAASGQMVTAMESGDENVRSVKFNSLASKVFAATMLRSNTNYGLRIWDSKTTTFTPPAIDSVALKMKADSAALKPTLINKNIKSNKK